MPISLKTISNSKGFTLIEIMIVLAIIAVAFVVAAPRLFKSEGNIKAVARHFLVMGKEVRNRARLTSSTMRIALDLDPVNPKYWVEKSSGVKLLDPDEKQEAPKSDDDKKKPPEWSIDTVLTKDKKPLPRGLYFGPIESLHMKAPQSEGTAYIYFFPEGMMEAASIQITNRKNLTWSLIYNPLTGQADIIEEARGLKDSGR